MSKFKLGQTIPAKFDIKDANGVVVQQSVSPTFNLALIGAGMQRRETDTVDCVYHAVHPAGLRADRRPLSVQLEHQGSDRGALPDLRDAQRRHDAIGGHLPLEVASGGTNGG